MKLIHYFKVASHFHIFQHEFYLALCHDLVEDGYLGKWILRYWKSLDTITRKKDEVYKNYIKRIWFDDVASRVKLADLEENMKRCPESLMKRYVWAYRFLGGILTVDSVNAINLAKFY